LFTSQSIVAICQDNPSAVLLNSTDVDSVQGFTNILTAETDVKMDQKQDNLPISCSALFQKILLPEKAVLNFSGDGSKRLIYCETQSSIGVPVCLNEEEEDDEEADAATLNLLSDMIAHLCSNSSTYMTVMAVDGFNCMEAVESVTTECTSSMKRPYSYPSELLMHEMAPNSCKNLSEASSCIDTGLGLEAVCSSDQKKAVVDSMIFVIEQNCADEKSTNFSALATTMAPTTAPTMAPTTIPTTAPTLAPAIASTRAPTRVPTMKPTMESKKPHNIESMAASPIENGGVGIQLDFLVCLIPLLFLVLRF